MNTISKTTLVLLALIIIAMGAYFFLAVPGGSGSVESGVVQEETPNVGIANPASTNCVNLGGKLEIVDEAEGQAGYCHLPDGRVCEEWALFRDNTCKTPR